MSLKDVISKANTGVAYPTFKLIGNSAKSAAVYSKLHESQQPIQHDNSGNRSIAQHNALEFNDIASKVAQNITDAETVMQLLPDTELTAQILISSILSPKDMNTTELTYSSGDGLVTPDVAGALVKRIKDHFEVEYSIEPLLPTMLREVLFGAGSYAIAVIPENALDDVINSPNDVKFESIKEHLRSDGLYKSLGLLGDPIDNPSSRNYANLSLENFDDQISDTDKFSLNLSLESFEDKNKRCNTHLVITDNPNVLKTRLLRQRARSQNIAKVLGNYSAEALIKNDRDVTNVFYKKKKFSYKAIASIKTQDQLNRRSVGNPLILKLPSDAVIPVHVPGNPEDQIGFFVMLDGDGNPLTRTNSTDHYGQMSSKLSSTGDDFASTMLSRVKSSMNGFNVNSRADIDYASRMYGELVETDLINRIKNGVHGAKVEIAKNDEIYRLMFSRALSKQQTQLLYIPGELCTYIAFKYNSNGTGKSLLEDLKIINSLRAMLMFSNVMASLKNSVGMTEVKIKLDEMDPNPQKTIEIAQHEIMRSRQQSFPLGANNPTDIVDYLQRASYQFSFEGHPAIPDIGIDFNEKNTSYVKPDTELDETLRKQSIMGAGMNPEAVDATFRAEFAESIVSNNLLLAKRVTQTQELFTPLLTDHLRKVILNSEGLMNDLKEILENNIDKIKNYLTDSEDNKIEVNDNNKDYLINVFLIDFINSFSVHLPRPNSVTLENQMTAMKVYSEALEVALEAWISDKYLTSDTAGEVAEKVSVIKEVIKAHYLRKWMAENGVLTELNELTAIKDDSEEQFDVYNLLENHISSLTKSCSGLMAGIQPVKRASDKKMDKINEANGESSEPAAIDSESTTDNTGVDSELGDLTIDNDSNLEEESTEDKPTDNSDGDEPKEEK